MSELSREIRTSLEVGFPEAGPPPELIKFRGRQMRAVPATAVLPFEDGQFEVVMLDAGAVSRPMVREAHRVLVPDGELRFIAPEQTAKQEGMTLPEVYSVIREGFNIVGVSRSPWWLFGFGGRKLTICARKKNWKTLTNSYRPYL